MSLQRWRTTLHSGWDDDDDDAGDDDDDDDDDADGDGDNAGGGFDTRRLQSPYHDHACHSQTEMESMTIPVHLSDVF